MADRALSARLVGVIHLPPLPGSPRYGGDFAAVCAAAGRDAQALAHAGFDGVLVENFGDVPYAARRVEATTVAAMTACALCVRAAAPSLTLGVNVLRSDAESALAIAAATEARMVRINVHAGARLTDQGLIEGRAYETLRLRQRLGLAAVELWCDLQVKHSAPLADRSLDVEAQELCERALADAVLLTGTATGSPVRREEVLAVRQAIDAPIVLASGVTPANVDLARVAQGVVVGSWLRADGRAGGAIDPDRAQAFAAEFRRVVGSA